MKRRALLAATAAASLVRPAAGAASSALRFVPSAPLVVLDPVFSTANGTVNHGYHVFDTLYAVDSAFRPHPQMASGHTVSDDGLTWTISLRDGLRFHDGEPVRAADCIASLRRWTRRDGFGQLLSRAVEVWEAPDDRTIRVRLKHRFPLLPDVLAKPTGAAFIMPERLARTDVGTAVTEMVGSGPYRFVADEYVAGSRAAYRRFDGYQPRAETPDWASGGKVAGFDRIEWVTIPDAATAGAALQSGDVDWWEQVPPDLVSVLKARRDIVVDVTDTTGFLPILRYNALHPPFDRAALRHAVLRAVHQADYLALLGNPGDPASTRECHSYFPCGTLYGTPSSPDPMDRPAGVAEARRLVADAGYNGERVVIINPTDLPTVAPLGQMTHDLLTRLGMNSELVETDWATVVQRRGNRNPPGQGGWNIFHTWNTGASMSNPVQNLAMRGAGNAGWYGWYANPAIEDLASAWLQADTQEARVGIASHMQALALAEAPSVPLGQFFLQTAYRRGLTGIRPAPVPFPWGIRKA